MAVEIKEKGRGYFHIDSRIWAKLTSVGLIESVIYLVLASGTSRDGSTTAWSTNASMKHAGMGWERAKAGIDRLLTEGFLRHAEQHTASRPQHELVGYRELVMSQLAAREQEVLSDIVAGKQPSERSRSLAQLLIDQGLVYEVRQGEYHVTDSSAEGISQHTIWLPNTIVTGTSMGEVSPVRRLRGAGCISTLRLFVDLYSAQNLRDDGGISPGLLRQNFDRVKIGERGPHIIWGFKRGNLSLMLRGPFEPYERLRKLKKDDDHAIWTSVSLLVDMGLLCFVPHILENQTETAEIVHPYGIGKVGELPIEHEIGDAADRAARVMVLPSRLSAAEDDDFEYFCPILKTMPSARMVGVARLTYRPHTRRTKAWSSKLDRQGRDWIEAYTKLAEKNAVPSQQGTF